MRKKLLIIISSLIILLVIIILCLWYFNSKTIFQRKIKFALPKTAEIIDTTYSIYYDALKIKAQFGKQDYKTIVEGIKTFARDNAREVDMKNEKDMYLFSAHCKFWDEKNEKSVLAYHAFKQGKWGIKTREIFILITQERKNEDHYYLHIYY